jgi:hypothetical protein
MRRWPTWLLVGALLALGSVAVADALRGDGRKEVESSNPRPRSSPAVTTVPLEPASPAMSGVLYYSNTEHRCRLEGVIMPGLEAARSPRLGSCRFSISGNAQAAFPGKAAWSPHGGLYAREIDGMIELGSPFSHQTFRFPGREPAFKPDGTFTYIRDNEIVEWTTECPPGSRLFTLTGDNATARCRRVLLSASGLHRALPETRGALVLKDLAWLSSTRFVTVVGDARITGYRELVPVIEGAHLVGATLSEFGEGLRLEASPRGSFFTAWYGDSLYTIRDRNGELITLPPLPKVRAVTWSPDERWTAVATQNSVFAFRTGEGEGRVRRLPIVAYELAWR